ncbi:unnamed protein product [Rotaria sp. Silwood1]|nr:unnamed protein product [Rotaria sp. Silwood1]CAF3449035.1 unnamed protein product [Rotaria sp. Silwood1]CAF4864476.1 unnamed protein product [Rotaria sp. Silwood1]
MNIKVVSLCLKLFGLALLLSCSIAQIHYGVRYYNRNDVLCTIQPKIPLYLVVAGAMGISFIAVDWVTGCFAIKIGKCKYVNVILSLLFALLMIAWYGMGCYWIFHKFKSVQHTDPQLPTYCDATLYKSAYITSFVFAGIIVLGGVIRCVEIFGDDD